MSECVFDHFFKLTRHTQFSRFEPTGTGIVSPWYATPVIALTADAVAGSKEKYISLGFVDYIAKPFNRKEIKEKLDELFK